MSQIDQFHEECRQVTFDTCHIRLHVGVGLDQDEETNVDRVLPAGALLTVEAVRLPPWDWRRGEGVTASGGMGLVTDGRGSRMVEY